MKFQILLASCLMAAASAGAVTVKSPDGLTSVDFNVNEADGTMTYSVALTDPSTGETVTMVEPSPLGLVTNIGDFSRGVTVKEIIEAARPTTTYHVWQGKKSDITYNANTLTAKLRNADGHRFNVEFEVSDNNVGYRYRIFEKGDTRCAVVTDEVSGFRFPEGTTTFLTPMAKSMTGWMRTQPSYEEYYTPDAPLTAKSKHGKGYTFPALFHLGDKGWVLLSETGVDGRYCAAHLSDPSAEGYYHIRYANPEDNNGFGSTGAQIGFPAVTPWRTITVGSDLKPIAETTVYTDLVDQKYEPSEEYKGRRSTWSWIIWQDNSINYDDQIEFIDLAADLGWESCLIDGLWSQQIGREGMEKLFDYAKQKGVEPLVWYNSNGAWNDAPQGLRMAMDNPVDRKKEMKWLRDHGVKGIKVDFFGGDKQETMKLYEQILSDANDYGISVIFHGCTMPRGWERMYPNYISSEAVRASENLVFNQSDCDQEAQAAAFHPFIRNALGAMEFGGTILQPRLHRKAEKGKWRRTGDAFQLATAILFQSAIQNFALTPRNLTENPQWEIDFMKAVPTTWDETVLLDGYPGKYVVLARRHADKWYVAAINAEDQTKTIKVNLPMMAGQQVDCYSDLAPKKAKNAKKAKANTPKALAAKTAQGKAAEAEAYRLPEASYTKAKVGADGTFEFRLPTGGGAVLVTE